LTLFPQPVRGRFHTSVSPGAFRDGFGSFDCQMTAVAPNAQRAMIAGTHMKNRKSAFIRNTPKGRITAVASQIVQALNAFP